MKKHINPKHKRIFLLIKSIWVKILGGEVKDKISIIKIKNWNKILLINILGERLKFYIKNHNLILTSTTKKFIIQANILFCPECRELIVFKITLI